MVLRNISKVEPLSHVTVPREGPVRCSRVVAPVGGYAPRSSSITYVFFRKRGRLPRPRGAVTIFRRVIAVSRFSAPVGNSLMRLQCLFKNPNNYCMDIEKCPLLVKTDTQNTSRSEFYNSLSYTRRFHGVRQSVRSSDVLIFRASKVPKNVRCWLKAEVRAMLPERPLSPGRLNRSMQHKR